MPQEPLWPRLLQGVAVLGVRTGRRRRLMHDASLESETATQRGEMNLSQVSCTASVVRVWSYRCKRQWERDG